MAVRNNSGHGVSSVSGAHNQDVMGANIKFTQAPGHQAGGMGGPKAADAGAYASRSMAKKKGSGFPPAR